MGNYQIGRCCLVVVLSGSGGGEWWWFWYILPFHWILSAYRCYLYIYYIWYMVYGIKLIWHFMFVTVRITFNISTEKGWNKTYCKETENCVMLLFARPILLFLQHILYKIYLIIMKIRAEGNEKCLSVRLNVVYNNQSWWGGSVLIHFLLAIFNLLSLPSLSFVIWLTNYRVKNFWFFFWS